jgi:hypothetical protein
MNALSIASLTVACTFTCAWVGTLIRSRLPESHLRQESQDVVRLGMGLVATMTALLLGLVTAGAKGTFDSQDAAIRAAAVNILTLDRLLARYGPDAAPIREQLRQALALRIQETWEQADGAAPAPRANQGPPRAEAIQDAILALTPVTEAQRWYRAEALGLTQDVVKTRWRMLSTSVGAVPRAFLTVVIFWLMATFASFGLYAPRNLTVLGVLFVASISVGAAVFLILELDGPLTGLIRISSEPLRYALQMIGR